MLSAENRSVAHTRRFTCVNISGIPAGTGLDREEASCGRGKLRPDVRAHACRGARCRKMPVMLGLGGERREKKLDFKTNDASVGAKAG